VSKILFITPNLAFGGAVKQATLLASGLPQPRFESHVATLQGGPAAEGLLAAGVNVHILGWRRWFDLNPLRRLRHLIETLQPDVIHAWGLASLRAALVGRRRSETKLVVSAAPCPPKRGIVRDGLLRILLQRADWIVPATRSEADAYDRLGIPRAKIVSIPPGVEPMNGPVRTRAEACQMLNVPPEARFLVCVGPLEPGKGFRDAIWAFDILKHLYEDLHLLVIGEGSRRGALEQFTRAIGIEANVHFAGGQTHMAPLFTLAEVVWVPSRSDRGSNVALEAQACARPVVACRQPGVSEIIADGEAGYLIAPGDKIGLARQTRLLLDQPERARQMGEAGKQRVCDRYSAQGMVDRFAELYER
jgi:glycosyltransferase involved in cell wall biosynthesis